ncbi:hypothetical protein [Providencia rettgeri]|uniref:hypothetical protein n=1 Tax=Providencia rettgeri TaxID=587 RepID=UPI00235FC9D3|nr:hypothetical protein [Providencia rettgeri]
MEELSPLQIAYIDEQIISGKGIAPGMFGTQTWGDRIDAKPHTGGDQIPECIDNTYITPLNTAARAWDKHAARPDGVFEPLKGNPAQKNAAAENFIREILKDPKVVRKDLSGGAFEYRLPSGKGIRYNADGSFNTVLDPTKVKK